jgi:hypothetical protein
VSVQNPTAAEIQWRLLRAGVRALSGPKFNSSAANLARTLRQYRKLLIAEGDRQSHVIYKYAIEHCEKRIKVLLPSVPIAELSKALSDLERAEFTNTQGQVLSAYSAIFWRTHSEPESVVAVHEEIKAALKAKEKSGGLNADKCLPKLGTVYYELNLLDLPTKRGKGGPERGTRHEKTSKNRT